MNLKQFAQVLILSSCALAAATSCDNTELAVQNISAAFSGITHLIENVRLAFMANHVDPVAIKASLKPLEQAVTNMQQLIGTTCLTGDQINQITASSVNLMNEVTNLGFSAIRVLHDAAVNGDSDQIRLVVREIMFSVQTLVRAMSTVTNSQDMAQFRNTELAVESLISVL